MTLIRRLAPAAALAAILAALAAPAFAGPVTLKANPVDDDGQVTLGDLFDGAGDAAGIVVARRVGPSVILQAGQLQAQASRAGLQWDNPSGLRRVAVRQGSAAPSTAAPVAPTATPAAARQPLHRASAGQPAIARNDMVRVAYEVGGVRLSVMGKAMRNAAVGEPVAVLNTASNRIIDAVATGPGQAAAGPAADMARAQPSQFASR